MSEKFTLGVVLSVTTGILLCQFDELHEFLDFLTKESLFTHQLPRAANAASHYIFSVYPELEFTDVPKIEGTREEREDKVKKFLNYLIQSGYKKEYEFEPMENFEAKNPFQELIEMRGSADGIIPIAFE